MEDIRIVGIIEDKVTEPKNDGTPGSDLYSIPFRLSSRPTHRWEDFFTNAWDNPPVYGLRHRPGIALVSCGIIWLNGTTIEEVRDIHKKTIDCCVKISNKKEREAETKDRQQKEGKPAAEIHKENVKKACKEIDFK